MRLMKSKHSKVLLSLVLALLIAVSMLPVLSSAATKYYSVSGTVSDATMNTITIVKNGQYRTFGKMDAKIVNATQGIALKDTVKIIYSAANPKNAVQITIISHSPSENRVPHEPGIAAGITGIITDATMNTITVSTGDKEYLFGKEDVTVSNAPDGILLGDKVKVTYYTDNPSEAIQIVMISHGDRHNNSQWGSDIVANRSFTGWVPDMGDHYIVVQDLQDGRTLTFYYDEDSDDVPEIAIGDVIKVLYGSDNPGTARRIIMVDQGTNH